MAFATFAMGSVACLQTQNLGGGSPGDAGPDAAPALVPIPHAKGARVCPINVPVPGDACDVAPQQCLYALDEGATCARTCVCAYEARTHRGTWLCVKSECAPPSRNTCREGFACLGDEHCNVADIQCTCREDQLLHCEQVIQ